MKWQTTCLCALLLGLHFFSFSQDRCGFDEMHGRKMKSDSNYRKQVREAEKNIKEYIKKNKNRLAARVSTTTAALHTIPVVVHVVHTGGAVGTIYNPSDVQIQGAINYLNQVYNGTYPGTTGVGDMQIQFALAVRDPDCNATNGINRVNGSSLTNYTANGVNVFNATGVDQLQVKNLARWAPSDYYNIWIVNKIDGSDGTSGSFTGGFAYFPGAPQTYDGTIMLATQMQSGRKTLPHEIGHAFGLYHPFEGGNTTTCPANTSCTSQGDYVCDTDPITQPSDFTCRTGTNSCTGTAYNSNTEYNYMNYTNCYNLFTAGQKTRVLAFGASVYRASLSTSSALTSTNIQYPYINPLNATCSPVTAAIGLSANYAGILNVQINNKNFGSGGSASDGGYINRALDCIKLLSITKGGNYSFSFNVTPNNIHQLRAWIDYNNDGIFDNTTEEIHYNSFFGSAQNFTTGGSFVVPNIVTANTVLRLRVIDDLVPGYGSAVDIADGCHNPTYGQAEDYPVYVQDVIILPVTLINFTGEIQNDKIVLKWSTASEQNSKSFDIEKSTDGIWYYIIGKINAAGNSGEKRSYSFDDPYVEPVNFYRIRINDQNGQNRVSSIIIIENKNNEQSLLILKNPFKSSIDLQLAKTANHIKLQLINTNGAIVAQKELSGGRQIHWEMPGNLSSGIYILRAIVDGKLFSLKVVKE